MDPKEKEVEAEIEAEKEAEAEAAAEKGGDGDGDADDKCPDCGKDEDNCTCEDPDGDDKEKEAEMEALAEAEAAKKAVETSTATPATEAVTVLDEDLLLKAIEDRVEAALAKAVGPIVDELRRTKIKVAQFQKAFTEDAEATRRKLFHISKSVKQGSEAYELLKSVVTNDEDDAAKTTPATRENATAETKTEVLEKSVTSSPLEVTAETTDRAKSVEVMSKAFDLRDNHNIGVITTDDVQAHNKGKLTAARLSEIEKAVNEALSGL